MMDIKPFITSPDPSDTSLLHPAFAPRIAPTMIIDATTHNSSASMPVSPKQGETITADSLNKQGTVSSSMTPTSWDSSPALSKSRSGESLDLSDKFQVKESPYSWNNSSSIKVPATSTSPGPLSPSMQPRQTLSDLEDPEDNPVHAGSGASARNSDQPDSSPSPRSQLNSSFEESESAGMQIPHSLLERRSRRKPIQVMKQVTRTNVAAYDSEESEIEDDILNDELSMMRKKRKIDEVDGVTESVIMQNGNGRYSDERLYRHEAVDGIPEDEDEEMEMRSESDSISDSDKCAYLKDVPVQIFELMQEIKGNAQTLLEKTLICLHPSEMKVRKDQYLLPMLANLRDRCLQSGLGPGTISAILNEVETDVNLMFEDLEDFKIKPYYSDSDRDSSFNEGEDHFLYKTGSKKDPSRDSKDSLGQELGLLSSNPLSFLNTSTAPSIQSSSPSSTSSSPTSDVKPIIVTVSADMKHGPPMLSSGGAFPPFHPLGANISESALNPNMFGNGKMPPWLPVYPFSSGNPFDMPMNRKFLPFEGKIGENVDKDYLKCQFCERTFRRQKNLENHVENTHQGKGPLKPRRETNDMYFKCSHCPYTTKHQSNLYVHLRIHTGERPYICGACGVQYSQSHSLKSHIINKHDGIMSYYIKEKRTRSPRGMGYLTSQVMHDNLFKMPPPPLLPPPMSSNMDMVVAKAIEMAKADSAQQQQQQMKQQPSHGQEGSPMRNGLPPPLSSYDSNSNNNSNQSTNGKSINTPCSTPSSEGVNHLHNNPLFSTPGSGPHHPFGHHLPSAMFRDLFHHHPAAGHLFPAFPHFPPRSVPGFQNSPPFQPMSSLPKNPSSAPSTPHLPQHMQLPNTLPHLSPSPIPLMQHQIKKEPQTSPVSSTASIKSPGHGHMDEAMDLRKKSPPPEIREPSHAHNSSCGGKENCHHAAKLKYLRLNVVRMLGILVPNLNFAEKGISAESESVDDLLQDVIESNTHDDEME